MTRRDPASATLAECAEALATWGFDPHEEESLAHAASWLQRLGNDRQFLGDMLIDMLDGLTPAPEGADALAGSGSRTIMLVPPGPGHFLIRARVWLPAQDRLFQRSGAAACGYGQAHDFAGDVLTLGYFGPGYLGEDYEYEETVPAGYPGERVALRFVGRGLLEQGRLLHYRSQRDVQLRHPPEALSLSIDLEHTHPEQSWRSRHDFALVRERQGGGVCGHVTGLNGHGPSESLLRIALGLGAEGAEALAAHFGRHHGSERMRLVAWQALAAQAGDDAARDAVWRAAEQCGSRLVAGVAGRRRAALDVAS
ncbi:transposase [Novosphingobium sp. KA1]|uniref:transposase n=1 Tax=Novosphingobium sp. (strain KA1) TaxID=164608 RepID=UPI001F5C60A5|nr:transposase [Novosphingobium sp. KA1]